MDTRLTRMICLISCLAIVVVFAETTNSTQAEGASVSQTLSPFTPPLADEAAPTATPASDLVQTPSPEAQQAMALIAQREGMSVDNFFLVEDYPRDLKLLNRVAQHVHFIDQPSERHFHLAVDKNSGHIEEWSVIEAAMEQAYTAKYGKLDPTLYERLQQLQDTDLVTVTIYVAAGPGQGLADRELAATAALAAKYPEAREAVARSGKPMDVADPKLSDQIQKEYTALLEAGVGPRIQPLVDALTQQGLSVTTNVGEPAITVELPKRIIQTLVKRDDVGAILLANTDKGQQGVDTASKSNRAPVVWSRGKVGTGVKIAFIDSQNVDFDNVGAGGLCPSGTNNCFLRPGAVRSAIN